MEPGHRGPETVPVLYLDGGGSAVVGRVLIHRVHGIGAGPCPTGRTELVPGP